MARARTKYLGPMYLDADVYARLEQEGRSQERDPLQHARWLLRQALQDPSASKSGPELATCTRSTAPVAEDAA